MMVRCIAFIGLLLSMYGCMGSTVDSDRKKQAQTRQVILRWNKLILELERHTSGYRPPVSARMFAYVQMAAYEAALPGLSTHQSVSDWIPTAPRVPYSGQDFQVPMAVNAAYFHLLPLFFPTAPNQLLHKADTLYAVLVNESHRNADTMGCYHSLAHGKKVAQRFWEFSMQDTLGHDAFLFNYDKNYHPSPCKGCWQASEPRKMPALLPYWGKVRIWVNPLDSTLVPPPPVYEETPGSKLYAEAFEVFSDLARVKKSEKWVAQLWSDDVPGLTCTTVGRWFSIATQFMEQHATAYPQMLETYLLLGIGLSDAAVHTWHYKFKFLRERPEDYIRRVIREDWTPLHEAPSFPAYPSGHAVFSSLAATILAHQFGDAIVFVDNTHKGRKEFNGTPKKYSSFTEMAIECAFSRITLGVHYRSDCESGIKLGHHLGAQILAHPLHKKMSTLAPR